MGTGSNAHHGTGDIFVAETDERTEAEHHVEHLADPRVGSGRRRRRRRRRRGFVVAGSVFRQPCKMPTKPVIMTPTSGDLRLSRCTYVRSDSST